MATTDPAASAAAPASRIATLFPGYFALVMATGIVAIAAELRGFHGVAVVLTWINVVAYLALWLLFGARLLRYPSLVLADLTSHQKGAAFLTVVAATNVLGSELLVTGGSAPSSLRVHASICGSAGAVLSGKARRSASRMARSAITRAASAGLSARCSSTSTRPAGSSCPST